MFYKTVKKSVSNYPNPEINCSVECFLKEEDMADETKAVYWIPFQINLVECMEKKMSSTQIDDYIQQTGKQRFEAPEMQQIFSAIEFGASLNIDSSSTTTTNTTDTTKTA